MHVAFAFKDFPLPMHANAPKAAEASHCAEAQGKYWEFHDLLAKDKQLALPALKRLYLWNSGLSAGALALLSRDNWFAD